MENKWTALQLSYNPEYDKLDPSKFDFNSEEEAWEYVFSRMCKICKAERLRALDGEGKEEYCPPSLYPACSAEWMVLRTDELDPKDFGIDNEHDS
jgi:hypothetical protein